MGKYLFLLSSLFLMNQSAFARCCISKDSASVFIYPDNNVGPGYAGFHKRSERGLVTVERGCFTDGRSNSKLDADEENRVNNNIDQKLKPCDYQDWALTDSIYSDKHKVSIDNSCVGDLNENLQNGKPSCSGTFYCDPKQVKVWLKGKVISLKEDSKLALGSVGYSVSCSRNNNETCKSIGLQSCVGALQHFQSIYNQIKDDQNIINSLKAN